MAFPTTPANNQVYRDGKGRRFRFSTPMNAWIKEYEGVFVGAVIASATPNLAEGYLWADGGSISRTTFPDLFTAVGTRFGTPGDSSTFFKPDLRGRVIVGLDDYNIAEIPAAQRGNGAAGRIPSSLVLSSIGQAFGAYQVQTNSKVLTISEIPAHSHAIGWISVHTAYTNTAPLPRAIEMAATDPNSPYTSQTGYSYLTGGNQGHDHGLQNVLQPSMFMAYVIKY